VSAGTLINLPQKDITVNEDFTFTVNGNISYVVDEAGTPILEPQPVLDANGVPTGEVADQVHINYENARRPRFIIQGKKAAVDSESNTIMLILYKEGEEGSGHPSDIMLRRVVVPDGQTGNPYRPENIVCNLCETADNGQTVCVDGAQNMSTVLPTVTTDSQGDPTAEDPYGAVKVVQWVQTEGTLAWPSGVNPYEDARAHRGAIMGDFIVMGYSYTPNWAAYRNGNDKYDFFIRRSFDGGLTWTTDPHGEGVTNCDTFTDPLSKDKTEVCTFYAAGAFEQARNLSQLPNAKSSVIEPRIVKAPGTIKNPDGTATGYPEDINTFGMYYVSYGTATNDKKVFDEEIGKWVKPEAAPMDLFYSFSQDLGETHELVEWNVNPDSEGNYAGETVLRWDFLAKGDPEQGEAQLRMTPDGSRFYAVWVQEGEEGSDIWFRRIMSPLFDANVVAPTTP
ncbi:MAG: choice-of-anchor O protein, partial [Anaerolineae bacterium]